MPPSILQIAQTLAVTLTATQTGLIFNSVLGVNAFSHNPSTETARIWRRIYMRGKTINLGAALISGSLWSYLAYYTPNQRTSGLYTVCAAIIPTFFAFALVVQKPLDNKILEAAADDKADPAQLRALFERFCRLTAVRAVIMGSAAITGAWAIVTSPRAI